MIKYRKKEYVNALIVLKKTITFAEVFSELVSIIIISFLLESPINNFKSNSLYNDSKHFRRNSIVFSFLTYNKRYSYSQEYYG